MNHLLFLAQAAAAAPAAAGTASTQGGLPGGMLIPMVLIFGIFYFMMIRPQQRKEKERLRMISELRADQRVVFAGGIIGTIVEAKESSFVIEVASGAKMEVLRGAVTQVLKEGEALPAPNAK